MTTVIGGRPAAMAKCSIPPMSRQTGCPTAMVPGGGWNRGGGRGWKMNPGVFVPSITDVGRLLAARGDGCQGLLQWCLCTHPPW